ncbi:Sortase family protein [Frankineae bacterium MT45]|nr:Sortase family protein [Frankineae bacterium MT45]
MPPKPLASGPVGAAAPAPAAASTTSPPVHIWVPAIGVSSGLQPLHLLANGTLQAPSKWQEAGWFAGGVIPGDPGPALIAGHIDSTGGPAVFFRLKDLRSGDRVLVKQASGATLKFIVDSVMEYRKTAFPTSAVYGPTGTRVLRLVTCTGDFNRAARSYVDNLVVSTHLASSLDQ